MMYTQRKNQSDWRISRRYTQISAKNNFGTVLLDVFVRERPREIRKEKEEDRDYNTYC